MRQNSELCSLLKKKKTLFQFPSAVMSSPIMLACHSTVARFSVVNFILFLTWISLLYSYSQLNFTASVYCVSVSFTTAPASLSNCKFASPADNKWKVEFIVFFYQILDFVGILILFQKKAMIACSYQSVTFGSRT